MIPAAPPVVCVRLRSRPMKKFGHVRSASMVDLLFREVQQKAAGHREQLHDTVLRNQRINEQKIEQQWALIQRNVSSRPLLIPLFPSPPLSSLHPTYSPPHPTLHPAPPLCVLSQNAGFVSEVRDYLALSTEQRQKLRESMYQRWCAQVFDPHPKAGGGACGGAG